MDGGSLLVALDKDGKADCSLGVGRAQAGIVEATSQVGVTIFVETHVAIGIPRVNLDIGSFDRAIGTHVGRLQLAKTVRNVGRQIASVVQSRRTRCTGDHLDEQRLSSQVFVQVDSTDSVRVIESNRIALRRSDHRHPLQVLANEGSFAEEQLQIDTVEVDRRFLGVAMIDA